MTDADMMLAITVMMMAAAQCFTPTIGVMNSSPRCYAQKVQHPHVTHKHGGVNALHHITIHTDDTTKHYNSDHTYIHCLYVCADRCWLFVNMFTHLRASDNERVSVCVQVACVYLILFVKKVGVYILKDGGILCGLHHPQWHQ